MGRNGIGGDAQSASDEASHAPNWLRLALYATLAFVLGLALFFAFELYVFGVLDQGECDRADCSWIGDLAFGSSANIVFGISLLVSGMIVWGVVSLIRRLRGPVRR